MLEPGDVDASNSPLILGGTGLDPQNGCKQGEAESPPQKSL